MFGLISLKHGAVAIWTPSRRPKFVPDVGLLEKNLSVVFKMLEISHKVEEWQVSIETTERRLRSPVSIVEFILAWGSDDLHKFGERKDVGRLIASERH